MQEITNTKSALITGGSSGIGLAIAKKFSENNFKVLVADKIKSKGLPKNIHYKSCDVAKAADIDLVYQYTIETIGEPDVLVLNAGRGIQQSINAFNSGKAVFCQKPLGRTAEEVKAVVEASAIANKLLAVDLSYRYTKAFQAVYKAITKGEIGEIYAVDLIFHNAYGPDKDWFYDIKRSGGGCVMDLGIHLIDLALWCLDFPEINNVKSHLFYKGKRLSVSEEQVEDYASVSMTSDKGAIINLQCSWHVSAGRDAVIEAKFFGTEGGAAVKNINGSFYDFQAEKYNGTQTEILVTPPDDWSGKAGVAWAKKLEAGKGYEAESAREYIKTAEVIDQIYNR